MYHWPYDRWPKFQSTLPSRGATPEILRSGHGTFYFNPRSPRGERPEPAVHERAGAGISIHAPLAGSDAYILVFPDGKYLFQSTLPSRGATWVSAILRVERAISIHAPLAGSDPPGLSGVPQLGNFNPRSPRGERPPDWDLAGKAVEFQSTLPSRGATIGLWALCFLTLDFNPRSPRGERREKLIHLTTSGNFNPRSPRGERPRIINSLTRSQNFNPRSPRGERPILPHTTAKYKEFQSTLPSRGATQLFGQLCIGDHISIHAPLAGSDSKNTQKALKRIERNAQSFIFVFPSSAIGFFPPPFFSRKFLQNHL